MKILKKFLVLLLLMMLTSCSGPSAKSESEILLDIQYQDNYFSDYNLAIDSSTITKRQTNQKDKTDYVWIELTAANDDFTYYAEYELMYVLYNDGWLLENYTISHQEYEVRDYESISQVNADGIVAENGYDEYTYLYKNNSYNQVDFYYSASTSEMFLRTDYAIQVSYTFRPNSGWSNPKVDVQLLNYYPDLVGTWKSNDYDMDLTLNVLSLEKTSDRDYDLTFTCEFTNASIDGSGKWSIQRFEARHTYIQDTPITINIHLQTNVNNVQTWNGDDFELTATDGTSHQFELFIFIGGQGGLHSWNTNKSADGCGIGWCEWQPLFFEKIS